MTSREDIRRILAITDADDFANEMRVTINGSRWSKIADSVGLDHVRQLLADMLEAWDQAESALHEAPQAEQARQTPKEQK